MADDGSVSFLHAEERAVANPMMSTRWGLMIPRVDWRTRGGRGFLAGKVADHARERTACVDRGRHPGCLYSKEKHEHGANRRQTPYVAKQWNTRDTRVSLAGETDIGTAT